MPSLLNQLQPLLASEDMEAITTLLEQWEPRDDFWAQCVEGRILAPSSSETQRQRMREVLQRHQYDPPASAASTGEGSPSDSGQGDSVAEDGVFGLPGIESAMVEAAARVAALPAGTAAPAREILAIVRRENLHQQVLRREQFEEDMQARRLPGRTTFAEFLGSLSSHFVRIGPPADEADLDALQALFSTRFSEQLIAFYRCFGSLEGPLGNSGIGLRLCSPRQLLDARQGTLRWQRLGGLSLLDMARWSWGNDRPDLEPDALPETVEHAARQALCVGWLFDGYGEQHGYLVQRADGKYLVHPWHQDDDFIAPRDDTRHAADLWILLAAVMRRIAHANQDLHAIDSLSELVDALDADAMAG